MTCQKFCALLVTSLRVRFVMLPAIKLYRQFCFTTVEIQNKPIKGMLSAKAETA